MHTINSTGPPQGQGRGRGRGRGRGNGRGGRGTKSVVGTRANALEHTAQTSESQAASSQTLSECDSVSISGSQITTSSATPRRYPMRSCRTNSVAGSTIEHDEHDDPPLPKRAARRKTKQVAASRRRSSARPNQLACLTEQTILTRSRIKSPPAGAHSIVSQAHMNPLFLRMSHWIEENRAEDVGSSAGTPASDSQSEASTKPFQFEYTRPTDTPTLQVPSPKGHSLGDKRPHSRSSSPNETVPKAFCVYPGQSIRNQSTWLGGSHLGAPDSPATTLHPPPELEREASLTSLILLPLATMELEAVISQESIAAFTSDSSPPIEPMEENATPRPHQQDLPSLSSTSLNQEQLVMEPLLDPLPISAALPDPEQPPMDHTTLAEGASHPPGNMDVEIDPHRTCLERRSMTSGMIPLMEYSHGELITEDIRESISGIGEDVHERWINQWPSLSDQGAQYVLERFRGLEVPTLLFTPAMQTESSWLQGGRRLRTSQIYLTTTTYLHLLALRAVTSFRTGLWEMSGSPSSPCSLAAFTLHLSATKSAHNHQASDIFTAHFIQAAHAKLYSILCIGGASFTKEKISSAFHHALKVQIRLQMLSSTDEVFRVTHLQEHHDAAILGRWLLFHQAIKMAGNDRVATIIAEIGPQICSSGGSDSGDSEDETEDGLMVVDSEGSSRSWQGPALTTCFGVLRAEGLYYGRIPQLDGSGMPLPSRRPPDGTPLSWILASYSPTSLR